MARTKKLSSALLPFGVVALVAGCGGGGAISSSAAGGGSSYVPVPTGGPNYSGTATLSFNIPVRKGGSSGQRQPRYLSPGTSRIDVTVAAAGLPSPWPNPVSTTVPSPAPSASSIPVTMTVAAPLGQAQFAVKTYDANGYLLSGVTSTPVPISNNAASNTITLTLNAAAECMQIDSQPNTVKGPASVSFSPFVHQSTAQTKTFVVTPCDVDGYPIPAGQQLANSLVFTTTNPKPPQASARKPQGTRPALQAATVTFSPTSITQGGPTTVTITQPAGGGSDAHWLVPSDSTVQYASISTTPVFYVITGNSGSNDATVFKADNGSDGVPWTNIPLGLSPGSLVAGSPLNNCTAPGQAVFAANGGTSFSVVTIPSPTGTNPTPLPVATTVPGATASASPPPAPMVLDGSCNVWLGMTDGRLGSLGGHLSAFSPDLFGPFSDPSNGAPQGTFGNAPISALGSLAGITYVGLAASGGYMNSMVTAANASLYPAAFFEPGPIKPGTVDAVVPYDSTREAIAYHDAGTGYLHFALFNGSTTTNDTNLGSNVQVASMAADPSGNVFAIQSGTGNLIHWNGSNAASSAPLPAPIGSPAPSAIAIAPNGRIFITDSIANGVYVYSWNSFTGTVGYAGTTIPTGKTPTSIAVFP